MFYNESNEVQSDWCFEQKDQWLTDVNTYKCWLELADKSYDNLAGLSMAEKAQSAREWWVKYAPACQAYESISLNRLGLTRLPQSITQCYTELIRLELKGNCIGILNDSVGTLSNLQELIFECTPIVTLPLSLKGRNIREIVLHQNREVFPNLPFSRNWFPNLEMLIFR